MARTTTEKAVVIMKYESSGHSYSKEKKCLLTLAGRAAPRVLHFDDDNCILITDFLSGALLSDIDPEIDLIARCFEIYAGCTNLESDERNIRHLDLLRKLHPLVLVTLSSTERRNLPRLMNLLSSPAQIPCHRDFHPRNIIVSEHGGIFVIDFEQYGNDNPALDVARMCFNSSLRFSFDTRVDLAAKFRDCLRRKIGLTFQDIELVAATYFRALTNANQSLVMKGREISVAPVSVSLAAARALAEHTNCMMQ